LELGRLSLEVGGSRLELGLSCLDLKALLPYLTSSSLIPHPSSLIL
jgi:hypothetical protein